MSYNFKKIADLESLNEKPDGATVVIETEGAVKRLQADKVGVTSWNDLKDRPFYEETTEVGGDTLTWDGNTDGLYIVGNMFAKISNATPTMDDFANGCIRETLVSGKIEIPQKHVSNMEGALCVAGEGVLIIPNDNMTVGGLLFEQAGVYTIYAHPDRFVSLTIPGYTGFVSKQTVIKPLDEKYLPDSVKGGGTASAIPDDEMLEFLMDMDIVQPLSNTNNAVYTDGNNKLYVL